MEKKHWYSLAFVGSNGNGNTYLGSCKKCVTLLDIENSKDSIGLMNPILSSCSYLGFMTTTEFFKGSTGELV